MKKGIMNNNWEKQEYSSKGYGDFKVERILYVDNVVNPKYKFTEEIDFDSKHNENRYAI